MIENVLASRYATKQITDIFEEIGKTILERELWIAVMKAQRKLGVDIPSEDIEKFERAKGNVNLQRIREIERTTRHDVKAKIEAFVEEAGAGQYLHLGMTSRDLTDNVEQMQIRRASEIILGKYVSVLRHLVDKSNEYKEIVLTARTHHQPAQSTLLGRRFSMWAEELLIHLYDFQRFIDNYPLRGIKGPVGTQFDMLNILGDSNKVAALEKKIAGHLGFNDILDSPGQVYPRSLDFSLVSNLALLASSPESFAKTMRLMAGYELITEGFKKGQVGSSAMPHKMNTRSSERICGLSELLKMYADGASRLSGDQWEEGDVSCSALRRVVIPDSFFTSDGITETTLTVLNEMGIYPVIIDKEVDRYLPFLATTEILSLAVSKGMGREDAHRLIKRYSIEEALKMRNGEEQNLALRLSCESLFVEYKIGFQEINNILKDRKHFVGNAESQIKSVSEMAELMFDNYPREAQYEPGEIL